MEPWHALTTGSTWGQRHGRPIGTGISLGAHGLRVLCYGRRATILIGCGGGVPALLASLDLVDGAVFGAAHNRAVGIRAPCAREMEAAGPGSMSQPLTEGGASWCFRMGNWRPTPPCSVKRVWASYRCTCGFWGGRCPRNAGSGRRNHLGVPVGGRGGCNLSGLKRVIMAQGTSFVLRTLRRCRGCRLAPWQSGSSLGRARRPRCCSARLHPSYSA